MKYVRLLALVVALALPAGPAYSEDAHKAIEVTEKKRPTKSVEVLSFGKFEGRLRQICTEMEVDGRRERLAKIAIVESKSRESCPSCRALWRSIDRGCRVPTKMNSRKGSSKRQKSKEKEHQETEGDHAAAEEGGAEDGEVAATPVPTPTPPVRQRYPSPAVLDLVSRLSDALYEADAEGGVYNAVDYVNKTVLKTDDFTPAERDYFEILMTYFMAAWQGRETVAPVPTRSEAELDELFH